MVVAVTKPKQTGRKHGEGSLSPRPNGNWQARWVEVQPDGTTRRRNRDFSTEDQAEQHLRQIAMDVRSGSYVPPTDRTVGDLIKEWLERGAARWKPATAAAYRQRAENHVLPIFGKTKAETLTTPRVQHWIDGLQRRGLDPSTIDNVTRILSGALREAVQIGVLASNPSVGVRRPPVRVKESATWSNGQIEAIMRVVASEPFWNAVYRVALATGMRPGELRGLKWVDIDYKKLMITVRRTMTKDADGRVVIGKTTKTGKSRQVAISASTVRALKSWEIAQKERRLACEHWIDDGLVFDRGDGQFLPLTTWQKAHTRFVAEAGIPRITFHQLRHTSATISLEAGQHPLIVSRRLGHRSIQTTLDIYSHISEDLARSAAEALDEALFGDEDTTTRHA